MHIEKVLGLGHESVYVFHFPSQSNRAGPFPCKIGRAGVSGAVTRIKSLQAGMQEEPVIDLIFKCPDSTYLEGALHAALADTRLETYGTEWFETTPDDIEAAWWDLQRLDDLPLYQQFRRARMLSGQTQADLAAAAGVPASTVSALERGFSIQLGDAGEIARELGLRLSLDAVD